MPEKKSEKRWNVYAAQGILLLLLLVVLFPGTFLRGEYISPADVLYEVPPWKEAPPEGYTPSRNRLMLDVVTAFYPFYSATTHAREAGEWPLWNPFELAGVPLLANCQSAVLYPTSYLYTFLPLGLAATVHILLKLWCCGMTAFFCALSLSLNTLSARFFSLAWMLGSYNVIWCYWSLTDVSVWYPLLFLATEWIVREHYKKGFLLLTLGGAFSVFSGHPESLAAFCIGLGVYFLVRLFFLDTTRSTRLRIACIWGCAWIGVILLAAPQILPFLEYLRHAYDFAAHGNTGPMKGYSLGESINLVLPRFYGSSFDGNYWGEVDSNRYSMLYLALPIWLSAALLIPCRKSLAPHQRRMAVALLVAGMVAFLVAFEFPLFAYLHHLPILNVMKKGYHAIFLLFALPLLAALGVEAWQQRDYPRRAVMIAVGSVLVLLSTWIAGIYSFQRAMVVMHDVADYVHAQLILALMIALLSSGAIILSCWLGRHAVFGYALVVLLVLDLSIATHGLRPTVDREAFYPDLELTEFMQAQPNPCRFGVAEGWVPAGLFVPYGIEEFSGYDALYPDRIMTLRNNLGEAYWTVMEPIFGIQYYLDYPAYQSVIPKATPGRFEKVDTFNGLGVYKNRVAQPRAFLVPQAKPVSDADTFFSAMRAPGYNPKHEVLLEAPAEALLQSAEGALTGQATITRYTSTTVSIDVEADKDCYLVLADAWYPGWTATIDATPVAIYPAYHAFRGLVLPKGKHTVHFVYHPKSFYWGLWLSAATVLALLSLGMYWMRKHPGAES